MEGLGLGSLVAYSVLVLRAAKTGGEDGQANNDGCISCWVWRTSLLQAGMNEELDRFMWYWCSRLERRGWGGRNMPPV